MIATHGLLAVMIVAGNLSAQEKEKRVCAMSKLVDGSWCSKCDRARLKSSKEGNEHAKPKCDGEFRGVRLCDKSDVTFYRCVDHAKEVDLKPGKCGTCGKERGAVRGSIGRVAYRCADCKAEGPATDLLHREGCKREDATAFCTESGKPPHDDQSEVEAKVVDIIVRVLLVPREKVTERASLQKDLGADDLDLVELVMAIEDALQITIADDDSAGFRTVGDVIRYVKKQVIK